MGCFRHFLARRNTFMADRNIWQPVVAALEDCSRLGFSPRFWLRDDDASRPAAALDRLIELTAGFGIPIALAIIPACTGENLAARIAPHTHAVPIVHGWAHKNHAGIGAKKQEFGLHRPLAEMQDELIRGLEIMNRFYPDRLVPMFVPPWNRIAPELTGFLDEAGYSALSRFGPASNVAFAGGIAEINTHVDIMDWRGGKTCKDQEVLTRLLADALTQSLAGARYAIGILTHHLVHDEAAWKFLETLFSFTRGQRWLSAQELVG
jgi:hypothetical protein